MRRIINYIILEKNDSFDLERKVRSYIKDGWQPLGGVNKIAARSEGYCCHQAMVKYKKIKRSKEK